MRAKTYDLAKGNRYTSLKEVALQTACSSHRWRWEEKCWGKLDCAQKEASWARV